MLPPDMIEKDIVAAARKLCARRNSVYACIRSGRDEENTGLNEVRRS